MAGPVDDVLSLFDCDDPAAFRKFLQSHDTVICYDILFPGQKHLRPSLFHYMMIMEARELAAAGVDLRFLLLDTFQNSAGRAHISEAIDSFRMSVNIFSRILHRAFREERPSQPISVLLESELIDPSDTLLNSIRVMTSVSTPDMIRFFEEQKGAANLLAQLWDSITLMSLPFSDRADVMILGLDETLSRHMVENHMASKELKPLLLVRRYPTMFYISGLKTFPKIVLTEDLAEIRDSVEAFGETDRKILSLLLTRFFPDSVLDFLFAETGGPEAARKLKEGFLAGGDCKLAKQFIYLVVPVFYRVFVAERQLLTSRERFVGTEDASVVSSLDALSSPIRLSIFNELRKHPSGMSVSELTEFMRKELKKPDLQGAHLVPHLKKLVDANILTKTDHRYYSNYKQIALSLKK